ncbi:MAG: hypothetical protein C0616_08590 [Desulfuromonas sp.]|nr:MAG: hypothetical protein C0616_08590 [Desulfuromonas sp.]
MMRNARCVVVLLSFLCMLAAGCATTTPTVSPDTPVAGVERYVDGKGKTGLSGQVVLKESGKPVPAAYVNIYPDTLSNLLGPSQFISSPTDANGNFNLDLPEGNYYVVARKRISGEPSGPLSPGDYYSEHKRITARVEAGKVGMMELEVVPMKAPMFFKKNVVEQQTETGIKGVLIDQNGKPVPGSFAMAYSGPDLQRLPDYTSTLSDGEGKFTIYLPQGGTFYIGARVHAWDMPRPGELYGRYGGKTPAPVKVPADKFVEGLTIVLAPFDGVYKPGKSLRPY